jgi:2,3-bisphosphoglycerate-dependent phosphoglycerate mutase
MDQNRMFENPTVTTLYLARHGQSEWNNQSRVTGQLNPGLSEKGKLQSEAIAHCLQDEDLAAIYTSVLQRAIDTAQPTAAAKRLPIAPLCGLNEINLGMLQGRYRDERDPEAQTMWAQWQANMWSYQVPGAERFDDLKQRVSLALRDILQRHRGRRVLVVGHRATNRVVMGELLGWPLERWPELRLRNKYLYRIELGAETEIATFTLSGNKMGMRHDGFIM